MLTPSELLNFVLLYYLNRYVQSEGDANGVIRGSYAYLDPNYEWRQVQYVADKEGFHVDPSVLPVANPVSHPHVSKTTEEM